jgi:hypothetical protein
LPGFTGNGDICIGVDGVAVGVNGTTVIDANGEETDGSSSAAAASGADEKGGSNTLISMSVVLCIIIAIGLGGLVYARHTHLNAVASAMGVGKHASSAPMASMSRRESSKGSMSRRGSSTAQLPQMERRPSQAEIANATSFVNPAFAGEVDEGSTRINLNGATFAGGSHMEGDAFYNDVGPNGVQTLDDVYENETPEVKVVAGADQTLDDVYGNEIAPTPPPRTQGYMSVTGTNDNDIVNYEVLPVASESTAFDDGANQSANTGDGDAGNGTQQIMNGEGESEDEDVDDDDYSGQATAGYVAVETLTTSGYADVAASTYQLDNSDDSDSEQEI